MLLDDQRIGLIDYGQFKRLSERERLNLCHVYAGLYRMTTSKDPEVRRHEEEKLIEGAKIGGYKSKYMNPEVLSKMMLFSLDRDGRDVTNGLNLQQYMDSLYAIDPWTDVADWSVMPVRLAFMLRGVGVALNCPVSLARAWGPMALKLCEEAGEVHDEWYPTAENSGAAV